MKRPRAARRGSITDSPEGEQGFWPSFADMMSSFALILFFLMLIAYLQNLITGNELSDTRDKLLSTEQSLTATLAQVTQAQSDLADLNGQIGTLTTELGEAQQEVADQQTQMALQAVTIEDQLAAIAEQQAEIADQQTRIAEQTASIEAQQTTIAEQQSYIDITNEELTTMRAQMEDIAGIRMTILRRMQESIGETLGDASKVSIGDNGNLVLSDGLLFDSGKYSINEDGKEMLDGLANALYAFLTVEDNRQFVDSIVISGHTDSVGTSEFNQTLSTNRANAVVTYLTAGKLKAYSQYFCASGYGESRPVADNSTAAGKAKNRRIEVSIILKDETVMAILDEYLANEVPDTDGLVISADTAA